MGSLFGRHKSPTRPSGADRTGSHIERDWVMASGGRSIGPVMGTITAAGMMMVGPVSAQQQSTPAPVPPKAAQPDVNRPSTPSSTPKARRARRRPRIESADIRLLLTRIHQLRMYFRHRRRSGSPVLSLPTISPRCLRLSSRLDPRSPPTTRHRRSSSPANLQKSIT